MRDIIAHRYFGLDPQIVWDAATTHVPGVLTAARRLLVQAEPENDGGEKGDGESGEEGEGEEEVDSP
jgi:hypothetical protein